MKKLVAIILCAALLTMALTGCSIVLRRGSIEIGAIGQLYDVNDRAEEGLEGVNKIVIVTVSDDVILKGGGNKAVAELTGQCRSVSEPVSLDCHKDGSTLYIEVKYPNVTNSSNTVLNLTVPEAFAGDLSVNTVSGDVQATDLPFKLQKVELGTISGEVYFSTASCVDLKVDTTSGDVNVSNIAAEVTAKTVSGEVTLDYAAFAATTVSTISGDVQVSIPDNAAFKVEFNTVSGDFTSTHPGIDVDRAGHGFSGSAAGGTELIKVNTTSGECTIQGN